MVSCSVPLCHQHMTEQYRSVRTPEKQTEKNVNKQTNIIFCKVQKKSHFISTKPTSCAPACPMALPRVLKVKPLFPSVHRLLPCQKSTVGWQTVRWTTTCPSFWLRGESIGFGVCWLLVLPPPHSKASCESFVFLNSTFLFCNI